MLLNEVLDLFPLLDNPKASGEMIKEYFIKEGATEVNIYSVEGVKGHTDFISIKIAGVKGKENGGSAKTLGIIGRLGGIGARPERIGFVSDGDGAMAALAAALKLIRSKNKGDILYGDVIIRTHICPNAPVKPHKPVPFMNSPVDMEVMNKHEVSEEMDAIISIDTTKGNNILNHKGIAISPTVKEGYILPVSSDLVHIMEQVSGQSCKILPLSTQDITPYSNNLYHVNSILQPATATSTPVVGLAITANVPVAGCATGASHEVDIALAAAYVIEVAKEFGNNNLEFYNKEEYEKLKSLYGSMKHLQTRGNIDE
ncbi:MAG: DUF1177 domain-containing protein [Clostridia bacterium]